MIIALFDTKNVSMLFGPTPPIFPKSAVQYPFTFQYHSSFWTTHPKPGILVYMVLKSNLPKKDPPTKYFPKVQLSISDTKKKIHAFWTHPPHFPQKCFLVYICILVPLLILDHPPHPRYFGLQDTKIKSSQEGPTHQIFPQSILQYHLHFSINCHFFTTHPPQWYFSIHGTKIKYRQKGPTHGTKIIIRAGFQYPDPPCTNLVLVSFNKCSKLTSTIALFFRVVTPSPVALSINYWKLSYFSFVL